MSEEKDSYYASKGKMAPSQGNFKIKKQPKASHPNHKPLVSTGPFKERELLSKALDSETKREDKPNEVISFVQRYSNNIPSKKSKTAQNSSVKPKVAELSMQGQRKVSQ
jgi:hypothetical protein